MTILEELIQYSKDCISGKEISCQKHIWACERFLKDIEKGIYIWSEEEAQRIVTWFSYLRHSKGVLSGQPITLTSWQKFNMCQLYGWRERNGSKRFKSYFGEIARKQAKSQMQAGILLYEISVQAVSLNEIRETYCVYTLHLKERTFK